MARSMDATQWARGGGRMGYWPVSLSLFVSWFSIISYTAIPGEMVAHGPWLWLGLATAPLVLWFVGWRFVPAIRVLDTVTQPANPYWHVRGIGCQRLATTLFVAMRLAWMALITHVAASVVLGPLTGIAPWLWAAGLVAATGATCLGGFRWVVWLDVVQAGVMFAGAVAVLYRLGLPVQVGRWPALAVFEPWGRVSIVPVLLSAVAMGISVKCGDAMNLQRFLAVRSIAHARRVLLVGFAFDLAMTGLLCAVGLSLLPHCTGGPADRLFLDYLVTLPGWLGWLVVAAMVSAAMSSLSSGIQTVVCTVGGDR